MSVALPASLLLVLPVPVYSQDESAEQDAADRAGLVPQGLPSLDSRSGYGAFARAVAAARLGAADACASRHGGPFIEFVNLIVGDVRDAAFFPLLPPGVPLR